MGQEGDVGQWLDRQAVMDLINRYADSVTRGDYEHTATLFAPDAVWEEKGGERFDTADDFVDYLVQGSASLELLIQTPHSSVIEFIGPDRATATTTTREMARGVAGGASALGEAGMEMAVDRYGIYYDELTKFGHDWKFTRRTFVPFFTTTGLVGDVSESRPLLPPG